MFSISPFCERPEDNPLREPLYVCLPDDFFCNKTSSPTDASAKSSSTEVTSDKVSSSTDVSVKSSPTVNPVSLTLLPSRPSPDEVERKAKVRVLLERDAQRKKMARMRKAKHYVSIHYASLEGDARENEVRKRYGELTRSDTMREIYKRAGLTRTGRRKTVR